MSLYSKGGMMPHPIHGRLSLHPIRVLVEWVAQLFTSRHRVSAVKVFVHPLQKVAGSTYPCLQKK